jgi:hypothetical protein
MVSVCGVHVLAQGSLTLAEADGQVKATHAQLHALMYELYGLTEKDIAIAEG